MAISALSAFRADLAGSDASFGDAAVDWLTVASLLQHAALVDEPDRSRLLRTVAGIGRQHAGDAERSLELRGEETESGECDVILELADRAEQAGAVHLASALVEALAGLGATLTQLEHGRVMARRARLASKAGRLDMAEDRFRALATLARRIGSSELAVRALIGRGSVAQMRGNYPEMANHLRAAARRAERAGLRELCCAAHAALVIPAGMARRFDEALEHGWKAYELAAGNAVGEGEILQNLGQALFDSGHTAAARAAFCLVLARPMPFRIVLPALGGLALASAASGDAAKLSWAGEQVRHLVGSTVPRFPLAQAMLECAIAFANAGNPRLAEEHRTRALAIANAHSFNELSFRAELLEVAPARGVGAPPVTLRAGAARIAGDLSAREPGRMPARVGMALSPV